jgi:LPS-assembly protein
LHRDLSSWIASLGFVVHDNGGVNDYGLVLTFTLKDIPGVRLPVSLDPEDITGGGSGKNR